MLIRTIFGIEDDGIEKNDKNSLKDYKIRQHKIYLNELLSLKITLRLNWLEA